MAAPSRKPSSSLLQRRLLSPACFLPSRQVLVIVGITMALFKCILGHTLNDNLFMEILYPEDISYTYKIRPARTFGGVFDDMLGNVHLVPTIPDDGCGEIANVAIIQNNVALIQRGHCSFLSKAIVAERAGAIAVVIYDNDEQNDWSFIDMIDDGSERTASIPAVFLLGRDGQNIKRSLGKNHLPGAVINIPVNTTGIPLGRINIAPWSLF